MAFSYLSGYDTKVEIDLTYSVINVLQKIQEYKEDIKDLQLTDVRYSSDLKNIQDSLNTSELLIAEKTNVLNSKIESTKLNLNSKLNLLDSTVQLRITNNTDYLNDKINKLNVKTGADETDYGFTTLQTLNNILDHDLRLKELDNQGTIINSNLSNIFDSLASNYTYSKTNIDLLTSKVNQSESNFGIFGIQTLNNLLDHDLRLKELDNQTTTINSNLSNIFDSLASNHSYSKTNIDLLTSKVNQSESNLINSVNNINTKMNFVDQVLYNRINLVNNTLTNEILDNSNSIIDIYNNLDTKLNIHYIYYVDKFDGSDSFDGKELTSAFKTLDQVLQIIPKTGANVTIYLNNIDGDGSDELLNVYQFNNRYEFKNCNIILRSLNVTQRYAVIKQGPASSLSPYNGYTYPAHFLLYNSYFKTEYCDLITASNSDLAVGADPYLPSASFFECFANTTVWIHSFEYEFTKVKFNDVKLFLDWKGDSTFDFYRCIIDSDYPSVDVTGQKIARLTSSSTLSSSSVTFESEIFSSDTVDNATVWSTLLEINDSAIVDLNLI